MFTSYPCANVFVKNNLRKKTNVNIVIRCVTLLPGLLFLAIAIRWMVDPSGAAVGLDMDLLTERASAPRWATLVDSLWAAR